MKVKKDSMMSKVENKGGINRRDNLIKIKLYK